MLSSLQPARTGQRKEAWKKALRLVSLAVGIIELLAAAGLILALVVLRNTRRAINTTMRPTTTMNYAPRKSKRNREF